MALNPSVPSTVMSCHHRRPTDVAWVNITDSTAINIVADWDNYNSKFNSAATVSLIINNVEGNNDNFFHVGDRLRLFTGFDTVYPNPLIEGIIPPNGIGPEGERINIEVVDYVGKLSYDHMNLDESRFNYNGWECVSAVEDVVEGMPGGYLTMSSSGTYDTMLYIRPDDKIYGMPLSRREVIDKIFDMMIEVDWAGQNRPMRYYYYQLNDYDGTNYTPRFRIIKEVDPKTATANKVLDATINAFNGTVTSNDEFYNKLIVSDVWNQVLQDDDSINKYGTYGKTLSKQYDNPVQNMDLASAILYTTNKVSYSYSVTCRAWQAFRLGDVVEVSNMRNGLFNGNHIVTEIRGGPTRGTITLSNAITDLSSFIS